MAVAFKETKGPLLYNQSSTSGTTVTGRYSWTKQERSSVSTRKRPSGLDSIKATAYNRSTSINRTQIRSYSSNSSWEIGPSPYGPAPIDFDGATYQAARKALVTKLRTKVKGEVWSLGTFIAELPETMNYFKDALNTLVRTYRAVKRGDMREVRRMRKLRKAKRPPVTQKSLQHKVAGKWLEWRYAVSPLMSDFNGALKALYDRSNVVKPALKRVVVGSTSLYQEDGIYAYTGTTALRSRKIGHGRLRIGLYYAVTPQVQAFKRLGLLNPVAVLWEVVPLSFVVDWFIPIGTYLASLDAMAGVSIWTSWESLQANTEYTYLAGAYSYVHPTEPIWNVTTYSQATAENRYYIRSISPNLSMPLPTFTLSDSANRILDALALSRQALGSKR